MFYILSREKGGVWATLEIDFDSLEDAKYEVACLKDVDEANEEEWEYQIIEGKEVEPLTRSEEKKIELQNEADAYHIIVSAPRGDMTVAICNDKDVAVDLARYYYSQLASWEKLYIRKYEAGHKIPVPTDIPYKVFTVEKETGMIIDEIRDLKLEDSLKKAEEIIAGYETEDMKSGVYKEDFYDIVNEYLESYEV